MANQRRGFTFKGKPEKLSPSYNIQNLGTEELLCEITNTAEVFFRLLGSWIFNPVTVAPVMDLARPDLTVSTSGSSGIYLKAAKAFMAALVSASFLDLPSAVAATSPSMTRVAKRCDRDRVPRE
jgi:hypothetical protein